MQRLARRLTAFFNHLWFRKEQPLTLGIFRIIFGLFLLLHFFANFENWERLYGPDAIVSLSEQTNYVWRTHLSIFSYCDQTMLWVVYWAAVVSAITFTLGFGTRLSTLFLYVVLNSCKLRDPWVMEGGEHVGIVVLFVLLLAPIGESYSISTFFKSRSNPALWPGGKPSAVWSLWLLRVLLTLIYGSSIFHKLTETDHWRTGQALYNILLREQHSRLISIELIHHPVFTLTASYYTLAIEFLTPILIWVRVCRPWLALALIALHAGIMVMMPAAIELFNLLMIIMMVLLIDNSVMAGWLDPVKLKEVFGRLKTFKSVTLRKKRRRT